MNLTLPRKKLFGDNFSSVFLENRVQGLQMYINGIMANETLRNYQNIRDFFCLDEAPSYSDSMVENRELYEAQEETISHLKLQLRERDETIFELRSQLLEEMKISVNETNQTTICKQCVLQNTKNNQKDYLNGNL